MKVKLKKTIVEGGNIKGSVREGRDAVAFVEGAIIDMSDASGKKYIEKGLAEPYVEPEPEATAEA